MKCPHCLDHVHATEEHVYLGKDREGSFSITRQTFPSCNRIILHLIQSKGFNGGQPVGVQHAQLIRPRGSSRPPCPSIVPTLIADDYREACLVLPDSAKASAALSRRCLQHLLRDKAGVKPGDLAKEIQQVIDSKTLPSHLSESIDAVRNIGNFSAHPMKSTNTGDILPVEPHEAEWTLDVLESLFDFYYVQPAILQAKRASLDKKLADAGKPPMK